MVRYQKAKSIEAELRKEREDQLEVMKGEAEKLEKMVAEGIIVNISRAYRDLATRVRRFIEGLEVVIDGEKFDTDLSRNDTPSER